MRLIACAAAIALSSCASVAPGDPVAPGPKLLSASAEVKSWGATLRSWMIDEAGRVEHISGERPGVPPASVTIEVRRLTLSEADRARLAAAVEKVEAILPTPEQCDERMTDGAYGTFRWDKGAGAKELKLDANCVKGRDAELMGAVFEADKIVDDAAKAVAPAERRPLANRS